MKKIKYFLLINTLIFFSFSVYAEEVKQAEQAKKPEQNETFNNGWFVGGLVGHGTIELKKPDHTNKQEKVTTVGVYGGYHFKDWFGLEASLYGTGELADNEANLVSAHLAVLTFTPKFTYEPNKSFSFSAKVGVAHLFYEEEYNNYILYQRNYDQSWSGQGIVLGLDASMMFSNGLVFRIGYDRIFGKMDGVDEWYLNYAPDIDVDLEQVAIGIHYQF